MTGDILIEAKKNTLKHLRKLYRHGVMPEIEVHIFKCKLCGRIVTYINGDHWFPEHCSCGDIGSENYGIFEEVGVIKDTFRMNLQVRDLFDAFWEKLYINELGEVGYK